MLHLDQHLLSHTKYSLTFGMTNYNIGQQLPSLERQLICLFQNRAGPKLSGIWGPFTDLVPVKYLHSFWIFHLNLLYYRFPYCLSLSHDVSNIFSKLANLCLEVFTGCIFGHLVFLLIYEYVLTMMNEFFPTTFWQALTCHHL